MRTHRNAWTSLLLVVPMLGCGENQETAPRSSSPSLSGGDTSAPSTAGSAGALSTGSGGTFSRELGSGSTSDENLVLPNAGQDGTAAGAGGQPACSAEFARTELQSVYLAFAFDVSGSMGKLDFPYHDPTLKWEPVVRASKAFFADPSSTRLKASLRFFPELENKCDAETYLQPSVAMTDLPSSLFARAIDAVTPATAADWRGGTPTLAVLQGTYTSTQEAMSADPNAKYAVVLVTDGYPQGCGEEEDGIEGVARAVGDAAAALPTYVIGVANPPGGPDTVTNLNRLAEAGGTEHAFLITTGNPEETARDFKTVIDSIRGQTLSCNAAIPKNPGGLPLDTKRVNVTVARANGDSTRLAYDETCASDSAWKFDDANAPKSIVLCDSTCTALEQSPGADLNVEFGCDRVEVLR